MSVRRLLAAGQAAASRLSEVEVASALARRSREGAFSIRERDRALTAFVDDFAALIVIELTAEVAAGAGSAGSSSSSGWMRFSCPAACFCNGNCASRCGLWRSTTDSPARRATRACRSSPDDVNAEALPGIDRGR